MHLSQIPSQGISAFGIQRAGASFVLLVLGCLGITMLLRATPDLIRQIARPCAGCYLGAFGPPLEPYGHPFRPPANSTTVEAAPLAATTAWPSLTDSAASRWLALQDTIGGDQTVLPGAARVVRHAAMFVALNRVPITDGFHARGGDPGYASAFGGLQPGTVGDGSSNKYEVAPTVWYTAPNGWGFPADRPAHASMSRTVTSAHHVAAATVADWIAVAPGIDPRSTEFAGNRDREYTRFNTIGLGPDGRASSVQGGIPRWHVAVQRDLERHFLQIGTYGTDAGVASGGSHSTSTLNMFSHTGTDVSYQYAVNARDVLSVRATLVHEAKSLGASHLVLGSGGFDSRDTFLADASWSIGEAVTPSIQYFQTAGSMDAIRYAWPGSHRNSAGVIAGIAYTPWNSFDSPIQFLNLRFAAQYVAWSEFGGATHNPGASNALLLSLWGAVRF